MKYLILGVNGMTGHMVAQFLSEKGHEVTGFAKQESLICRTFIGDAMNRCDIEMVLDSENYDYVINCIGILNQSVDRNPEMGIYLNSVLPHVISGKIRTVKTKLIQISTDCVFKGTKGKYTEWDAPDASSFYGRSKILGEVIDDKNLTIRTSIVGPELKANGIGLFHWFMSQDESVEGYVNVIWSGVTTLQLAKAIEADARIHQTGLYHLVNNQIISKYDLLCLFNKYCRKKQIQINKNVLEKSDRSLQNTRNTNFLIPEYEEMIKELSKWMYKHSEIYGQYERV